MPPLKIQIPNPCSQKWQEMLPGQEGKICSHCATEVIDFTKFSNVELRHWFEKTNGERVCGNFKRFQLEDFNREQIIKRSWYTISSKMILASYLTLFLNTKAHAGNKLQQNQIVTQQNDFFIKASILKTQKTVSDSLVTIKGLVKAADDNSPLPGVWVGIKNGKHNTVTDVKGKFSIQIPLAKTAELVFKYIGYNNLTEKILVERKTNVVILLEMSSNVMGEVVIPKPSWFKRTGGP